MRSRSQSYSGTPNFTSDTPFNGVYRNTSSSMPDVLGTAWKLENYVHVRWAWLALPLSLCLFSLSFLAATIIKSSRQRADNWKSSSLAMLYGLQVQGEDEDESGFLSGKEEMERRAKGSLVKLKKEGKKWRLVAQQQN